MKSVKYIILGALTMMAVGMQAEDNAAKWEKYGPTSKSTNAGFIVRAGYVIGGTTPLPPPAEIRKIVEFAPKGGFNVGVDGYKMFTRRWGIASGLHFFYQGFHTVADVKGYYMSVAREGDTKEGYFTGRDESNVMYWGFTIPLVATFAMSARWNVSFGPYIQFYTSTEFSGEAYENADGVGYLREFTPTGQYVPITRELGASRYDFSDWDGENYMRQWGAGLELTFDWKALKHMNVFGTLDWGLTNAVYPDFSGVQFPMYNLYATIGLAYRY
jgi:hypothetical protein